MIVVMIGGSETRRISAFTLQGPGVFERARFYNWDKVFLRVLTPL